MMKQYIRYMYNDIYLNSRITPSVNISTTNHDIVVLYLLTTSPVSTKYLSISLNIHILRNVVLCGDDDTSSHDRDFFSVEKGCFEKFVFLTPSLSHAEVMIN